MSQEFISNWWSIELEPGWLSEAENECWSFWLEDGMGALQISAYKYDTEPIPATDLTELMENQIPEGIAHEKTQAGEFSGVEVNYVEQGNFWYKLWVTKGSLLLFITYNCDAKDKTIERDAVEKMLAGLKTRM